MDLWNGLMEWMTCKTLGAFKEYCGIAGAILVCTALHFTNMQALQKFSVEPLLIRTS